MICDLHLHTTASDGAMTPAETVLWAKERGLDLIALTDHDTADGIEEALSAGRAAGVDVIPGIEISAHSNCEIHILGYNFDYKNSDFCEELLKVKAMRRERNMRIGERLSALGIVLDLNFCEDGIGRMNIARRLLSEGHVETIQEAFDRFLAPGGLAWVEARRYTPVEAVKLIAKFGGISVIAHPKKFLSDGRLPLLVEGLTPFGLSGLEVYYPGHTDADIAALKKLAAAHGLLETGGSDFHGEEDRKFGVELPARTLRALGRTRTAEK